MRLGPALFAVTVLLALSGCGGKDSGPTKATSEGPKEATPANHLPWIKHLVKRGSIVVYPRYEMAYEADPMPFIVNGVRAATKRVDVDKLPVLSIGYSRGGAIAVE